MNNPVLLLADEPTGNLDTRTSIEVMGIFQRLNAQGLTIVLVTHEPDIAEYARASSRSATAACAATRRSRRGAGPKTNCAAFDAQADADALSA